jgi:hypothetical protein
MFWLWLDFFFCVIFKISQMDGRFSVAIWRRCIHFWIHLWEPQLIELLARRILSCLLLVRGRILVVLIIIHARLRGLISLIFSKGTSTELSCPFMAISLEPGCDWFCAFLSFRGPSCGRRWSLLPLGDEGQVRMWWCATGWRITEWCLTFLGTCLIFLLIFEGLELEFDLVGKDYTWWGLLAKFKVT